MAQYPSTDLDTTTAVGQDTTMMVLDSSIHDMTGQQVTRAAIFCTDECEAFGNIAREDPIWLLPIAGRPMLDRVLGHLADFGIKSVDLFVSQHAIETYNYVVAGTMARNSRRKNGGPTYLPTESLGSRWGVELKIIDVTSTHEGLRRLVYRELDEPILIGTATAMPPLAENFFQKDQEEQAAFDQNSQAKYKLPEKREIRVSRPILFRDTLSGSKTAWMITRPECFVGQHCQSLACLAAAMETSDEAEVLDQKWSLSVESVRSILHTQRLLMEEAIPGQPIEASRVEPGLWIGRNVDLHPSVRLIPPVYIGADCRIESGVVLGPNAVVENHCIIGQRTNMADSLVLPDTFVGHELSLGSSIAGPCFLQTLDATQPIEGIDRFILGPNQRVIPRFFTSRFLARVVGTLVLVVLALPIFLLWCLGRACGIRRPLRVRQSVQLPAYGPSNLWRTFPYREFRLLKHGGKGAKFFTSVLRVLRAQRWPGLINVASGKVAWVGLRPRSVSGLAGLPDDRRALCMRSKVGLIRLAELDAARHGSASGDQEYASDIYYVATESPWYDVCLFWRTIWSPWFRAEKKEKP